MKKLWIPALCMLAMAGMTTTSCTDDVEEFDASGNLLKGKGPALVAGMPEVLPNGFARTELGQDPTGKTEVQWSVWDKLSVFFKNTENVSKHVSYTTDLQSPARRTTFWPDNTPEASELKAAEKAVALYHPINTDPNPDRTSNDFVNRGKGVYDPATGMLSGLSYGKVLEGTTNMVVKQLVTKNQFDPCADLLVSKPLTNEELNPAEGEATNVRFTRLNGLIGLKLVDKTANKFLTGKNVVGVQLLLPSDAQFFAKEIAIDTEKGRIVKKPIENVENTEPNQAINYDAIAVSGKPQSDNKIPPFYCIGEEGTIYISTLPGRIKEGSEMLVMIRTEEGMYLTKSIQLKADAEKDMPGDFVVEAGKVTTLTLNLDAEDIEQTNNTYKGNVITVFNPGNLAREQNKQELIETLKSVNDEENTLPFEERVLKIKGFVNNNDLRALTKAINELQVSVQNSVNLDLSEAMLVGGVLEENALRITRDMLELKLPMNVTTLKRNSLTAATFITLPNTVENMEAGAMAVSNPGDMVFGMTYLGEPTETISIDGENVFEENVSSLMLNSAWKNDPRLDMENKTWLGKKFFSIEMMDVDKNGKATNVATPRLVFNQDWKLLGISLTTTGVNQIHTDMLLKELSHWQYESERVSQGNDLKLFIAGNINALDLGRILNLYTRQRQPMALDLSLADLKGDGTKYTLPNSTTEVTFAENDVLPANAMKGFKYLIEVELPISLKKIGDNALAETDALLQVNFFENVVEVGENVITKTVVDDRTAVLFVEFYVRPKEGMNSPVMDENLAKKTIMALHPSWKNQTGADLPNSADGTWKGLTFNSVVFIVPLG